MMAFISKAKKFLKYLIVSITSEYQRFSELEDMQTRGEFVLKGNNVVRNSSIAKGSYVALNSIIYTCDIGKYCSIGPNVIVGFGDHPIHFLSTSPAIYAREIFADIPKIKAENYYPSHKRVSIGNDVWIGSQCYIKNGISIGDGAIIGAGSIVLHDVPPYAISVGTPAKVIKYRFTPEVVDMLRKMEWWNLEENQLRKIEGLLSVPLNLDVLNQMNGILSSKKG